MTRRWLPKNDKVNLNTKPGLLNDDQIEYILAAIPGVNGLDRYANMIARANIVARCRTQLMKLELVNDPIAIEEFIRTMVVRYEKARTKHGSAIGIMTATSISSIATQLTLDTHKSAGSGSTAIQSGLNELSYLFYAVKTRKPESLLMIIHFNTKVSLKDVVDMRSMMVDIKVSDFITDYTIGTLPGITVPAASDVELETESVLNRYWWHDSFIYSEGQNLPNPSHIMRLHLNTRLMYAHRVTPKMIGDAISARHNEDKTGIKVVYSPFSDGILDIIPIPERLDNILSDNNIRHIITLKSRIFLDQIVRPKLPTIRVKGILGIRDLIPYEVPLAGMFSDAIRILPEKAELYSIYNEENAKNLGISMRELSNRLWRLPIRPNSKTAAAMDINPKYVEKYLDVAGLTTRDKVYDFIHQDLPVDHIGYIVYVPNDEKSPNAWLIEYDRSVKDDIVKYQDTVYTYAVSKGANLDEISQLPWIDMTRTISNDIHQISEIYGCETSRAYFLFNLMQVLESSNLTGINSRHITMIADLIYNRGYPLGIDYYGSSNRGGGFITTASMERAKDVYTKGGMHRRKERMNITPSIMTGQQIRIGKGAWDIGATQESVEDAKKRMTERDKWERLVYNRQSTADLNARLLSGTGPTTGNALTTTSAIVGEVTFPQGQTAVIGDETGPVERMKIPGLVTVVPEALKMVGDLYGGVAPVIPEILVDAGETVIVNQPGKVDTVVQLRPKLPDLDYEGVLRIKINIMSVPGFIAEAMASFREKVEKAKTVSTIEEPLVQAIIVPEVIEKPRQPNIMTELTPTEVETIIAVQEAQLSEVPAVVLPNGVVLPPLSTVNLNFNLINPIKITDITSAAHARRILGL